MRRPAGVTLLGAVHEAIRLASPIGIAVFATYMVLGASLIGGYLVNRCMLGKSGLSALPLYDYFMKKWRDAPLFEPVFFR